MNDVSAPPSPEEEILMHLVEALDQATNRAAVVDEFCRRHPDMSAKLRQQAALLDKLDQAGAVLPARLGDFRILRRLESGGMGVILEAVQEPLGRRVAVKVIRPDRVNEQLQARFRREQKVLAALHQTNIVPIHAAGQEGELHYFAMPFLQGATLEDVIQTLQVSAPTATGGKIATLATLAGQLSASASPFADAPAAPGDRALQKSALPEQPCRALPADYFESVARFMAEAAEALEHAHHLQILHRDIKPSNLMVDQAGHCWIIDFGLATYLGGSSAPPTAALPSDDVVDSRPGASGTLPYMAPEQCRQGELDERTDVWGLGVTLYEMLALRRAFAGTADEVVRKILGEEPASPRTWVRNVPRDLAAICRQAIHKDPARRYARAADFAEDLRRWLRREPLQNAGVVRRAVSWARRRQGAALALATALAAALVISVGLGAYQERAQEGRRQELMRQMQIERQELRAGWSARGWSLLRQAAAIRADDVLRNQGAAGLGRLDARLHQEFKEFDASAVLFDPAGKRLLIGGAEAWKGTAELKPRPESAARILDLETDIMLVAEHAGPGPVAFRKDGTPVHLVVDAKDRLTLRLWDITRRRLVREFKIPGQEKAAALATSHHPVLHLTPDASVLAAAAILADSKSTLVVWEVETGKMIRQEADIGRSITAVAVHGEAGLLVVGYDDGQITVGPLRGGKERVLPATGRSAINCLALHRSNERQGRAAGDDSGWLLAAGDDGGQVVVWDLQRDIPVSHCHGSTHSIYAITFSPDGATLVTGGRQAVNLWDTATGRLLLHIDERDFHTSVAVSPDGKRLAYGARCVFSEHGGVMIWNLEASRGIQTLRGLTGPVAKVRIAPDGKYVAALSHDWRVGIWDLSKGLLLHVLSVPQGFAIDNAALAFSRDDQRFAFASGSEARMWNLATGAMTRWRLPPGLQDALAFDAAGERLMLCRLEPEGGMEPLFGVADPARHPRVCRVRDLLGPDPVKKELATIRMQDREVVTITAAPEASYFAIVQRTKSADTSIRVFAGFSDREVWSQAFFGEFPLFDPTGKVMALPGLRGQLNLVEIPSWKLLGSWDTPFARCISPGGEYWAGDNDPANHGYCLGRRGKRSPLVTLGIDVQVRSTHTQFSDDGRWLAWGNQNGAVAVCDIAALRHKLAEVGLGWE